MTLSMIALPDIHASLRHVHHLLPKLADVDLVILAGDMTNGRLSTLTDLLNDIKPYNSNIMAICGNHDKRAFEHYLQSKNIDLHGKHRIFRDLAFIGASGSLPRIKNGRRIGGYLFTEAEYEQILATAVQGLDDSIPKILVAHHPPYNTVTDITSSAQHVGCHATRNFIEHYQPLICFTGHIHESVGIDQIGNTYVINSGAIAIYRQYAYAEITTGHVSTIELRSIYEA